MGRTLLLYHTDNDGFGAFLAFYTRGFPNMAYVEYEYGRELPDVSQYDRLIFADVIGDLGIIGDLLHSGMGITIIDHHVSLKEKVPAEWYDLPNFEYVYDSEKSGCVLAWEYLNKGKQVPELLSYVQDRDLWTWNLPNSREVNAGLDSISKDYVTWTWYLWNTEKLFLRGQAVISHIDRTVALIAKQAQPVDTGVCVCNCTSHWSEVGNYLIEQGEYQTAFLWYETNDGSRKWSIRGEGAREYAEKMGGGGHPRAAGFLEQDNVDPAWMLVSDLIN